MFVNACERLVLVLWRCSSHYTRKLCAPTRSSEKTAALESVNTRVGSIRPNFPEILGPKLNGSVRSNRKSFEKAGPPFEVVGYFSRSDRTEFWLNGSRPPFLKQESNVTKKWGNTARTCFWSFWCVPSGDPIGVYLELLDCFTVWLHPMSISEDKSEDRQPITTGHKA